MTFDTTRPLGPLDSQLIAHLNATLGPPAPRYLERKGDRDLHAVAWSIGLGRIEAGQRRTEVEIFLTANGTVITVRRSWTGSADENYHESTGDAHVTVDAAYRWLLVDGKGKLGSVSKMAWVQACRNVPLMAALEFERID
jgi:hypothetical protein